MSLETTGHNKDFQNSKANTGQCMKGPPGTLDTVIVVPERTHRSPGPKKSEFQWPGHITAEETPSVDSS